jgi:Sec-independent protein secretion pathway component TatC
MGLLFQFPIVLTPLIRLKVIPYQKLVKYRATIYVALLILVMLLPGTDILTDFLEFFPLAFLFELTLLLNRRYR